MILKKLSRMQKMILLIVGLLVILFLVISGKIFRKNTHTNVEVIANDELLILGTAQTLDALEEGQVYTDKGIYELAEPMELAPYLYQSVQAVTEDGKILHISNLLNREVKLNNCLIVKNTPQTVTIFLGKFAIEIPSKSMSTEFLNEIADVYVTNGIITKISTKKEMIKAKILSIRNDGIELEGYGTIPISKQFRFYETHGDYRERAVSELIVGYDQADFVVADGEVCAAVLKEPISLKKIRVLLKTTDYAEIVHSTVSLKALGDYEIIYGDKKKDLSNGEEMTFALSDEYFQQERVFVRPKREGARLEVKSIGRNCGTPSYAGSLEIVKNSGGFLLINEVDLEEYLYGVVPSEMPASYELEALKAQAVCARSYAYRQILLNSYAAYGAHVDDSVSYQVYNNLKPDEKIRQAVNETAGKVLKFNDEVAITYYFSTSCGHTTSETIWENGSSDHTYISAKLLNDSKESLNLKEEKAFREFILNEGHKTYDSGEAWYRWDVTVPVDQLTNNVKDIQNIGTVKELKILERNEGGVVQKIQVVGTQGELELAYEYAIRQALNGNGQTIHRKYGKDVVAGTMLPSGFFVIDPVRENEKLTGYRFRGGGFGHGAGMSQNGAHHMAEQGKNYQEILELFYEGAVLADISYD